MTDASGAHQGTPPRRRGRLVPKLLLLGLTCVVVAAVAEIAVRPFVPMDYVGPSAVRYDAVYGRALIPGYSGVVSIPGVSYTLRVNSLGLRGPEPTGSLAGGVLCLGDSYAFGDGVSDGDEFPRLLGSALGVPVVNASLAGEGQGRWVKYLNRDAAQWSPRCVILQMCSNDFRDNHEDRLFDLDAAGALVELPVPPESTLRAIQARIESVPLLGYSRLYALAKHAMRVATGTSRSRGTPASPGAPNPAGIPWDDDPETSAYDDLTFVLVRESLDRCAAAGWPVIGVVAQIEPGSRLDRILAEFDRSDAPVVVVPTKRQRPDLHHDLDGHWNESGHRFAVDALIPLVERALQHASTHENAP